MQHYRALVQIEFDLDIEDHLDPRDHPVFIQIADIVMPNDNATMSGEVVER